MYIFRRFCRLNSYGLKNCFNFYTRKNIKTVRSVCASSQKYNDISQPQKSSILVYEAPLRTRVKAVKYLSLSSSMIGFGVFPTVIYDLSKVNILIGLSAGTVSLFFLSTPFLLNWITKRYVLELHFESETKTFTAKTFNIINRIQETKFKAEDVMVPDLPGMFTSFLVNGKPLFVDANLIQDPDAFSHMMGYDKPLDILLKSDEKNTS